jgi:uncharacterized protein
METRMARLLAVTLLGASACAWAGGPDPSGPQAASPCTDAWYRAIEAKVPTGDGQGHGPDWGSDEWKSVVEFKLGIRGKPGVPARDSVAWCTYIDQIVIGGGTTSAHAAQPGDSTPAPGPSFGCAKVAAGSIEAMVCSDGELSALDRQLASVYAAAAKKAANEHPPVLKAEQRGWIKGRGDCWKSDDKRSCVRDEDRLRIAELQARYRLVASRGPFRFVCDGNPANEVITTFFETDPGTLIAERGDSVSLMYQQRSASGTRYQGRNETFWEHQGVATITWGYGAPEMRCTRPVH